MLKLDMIYSLDEYFPWNSSWNFVFTISQVNGFLKLELCDFLTLLCRKHICIAPFFSPFYTRTVRNPHSFERYTGGSSSGSAAIVSCGLCPAALGTDGGG